MNSNLVILASNHNLTCEIKIVMADRLNKYMITNEHIKSKNNKNQINKMSVTKYLNFTQLNFILICSMHS